jgi:outer membrane protein
MRGGEAKRSAIAARAVVPALAFAALAAVWPAHAQTLEQALALAYVNNPSLNAQRAATRVVDENVPQALSGFRPRVTGTADAGIVWQQTRTPRRTQLIDPPGPVDTATVMSGGTNSSTIRSRSYGVVVTQNVFNGFRDVNLTRSAESQVRGSRETLRNTEQNVLLDGVIAYMDVLRDTALVSLQEQNLEALREQQRATRDRFEVGELTRTDVAQADARVAQAESELSAARAALNASRAVFRRVIGVDPRRLTAARPVEHLVPRKLESAIEQGDAQHPALLAARHAVDTAQIQVKVAEGELLPIVDIEGAVTREHASGGGGVGGAAGAGGGGGGSQTTSTASLFGRLTVPIYQGGGEYSRIRQSKETLGQRRLEADVTRDEVRAAVIQAFGLLNASRFQVEAAQAQVTAAQIALNGVQEEFRVGQRTTLDVLNAQAELVGARVALVTAQRDRVVNSYSLLAGVGRLSVETLNLRVATYEPEVHYHQVRDRWFGVRTPDGR